MANPATAADRRAAQPGTFLSRLKGTAIRAWQTVFFAATFVLLSGALGAFVLKPIVALVVWCWGIAWPAL